MAHSPKLKFGITQVDFGVNVTTSLQLGFVFVAFNKVFERDEGTDNLLMKGKLFQKFLTIRPHIFHY